MGMDLRIWKKYYIYKVIEQYLQAYTHNTPIGSMSLTGQEIFVPSLGELLTAARILFFFK